MKDKEWSGLLKIPSEVIIKELRLELGIKNSEIEELKYNLDESKKKEDIYLQNHNDYLKNKIVELETKLNKQICLNASLRKKYENMP